jgi:hypothetical protein
LYDPNGINTDYYSGVLALLNLPNNKFAMAATGFVRIYNSNDGSVHLNLRIDGGYFTNLALLDNGNLACAGGGNGAPNMLRIFNPNTGSLNLSFTGFSTPQVLLTLPNGNFALGGYSTNTYSPVFIF